MDFRFDIIYEYRWMFLYGALTTLGLTVVATAGSSVLGLLLALARLIHLKAGAPMRVLAWALRRFRCCTLPCSGVRRCLCRCDLGVCVVSVFVHPSDGILVSGEAAIALRRGYEARCRFFGTDRQLGAYICEIFRAGIQSIDKDRWRRRVLWD